jgi:integrase
MKLSALVNLSRMAFMKPTDLPPELDALWDEAGALERACLAPGSEKTYIEGCDDFQDFCDRFHLVSFPATPQVLALYLAWLAPTRKFATVRNRLCGIGNAHMSVDVPNPTYDYLVHKMLKGIAHVYGTAQKHAEPLTIELLRPVVHYAQAQRLEAFRRRDPALLLWGFASELRSINLVSVEFEDLTLYPVVGYTLHVGGEKNDPMRKGRDLSIPYGQYAETCPVRAMQAWLEYAQITAGPIFRGIHKSGRIQRRGITARGFDKILKRLLQGAGLEARYSPHSLRAGGATTEHESGASDAAIMLRMGITTPAMLMRYISHSLQRRPSDNFAGTLRL